MNKFFAVFFYIFHLREGKKFGNRVRDCALCVVRKKRKEVVGAVGHKNHKQYSAGKKETLLRFLILENICRLIKSDHIVSISWCEMVYAAVY